ncbi:MAG TPA: hypothetical protein ENK72_02650 [Epsilonproteobacteria bacterium]|nr:hypothetical protein [Campylobacterota bacterium]
MVVLEGVGKFIKVDSKREVSEVWEETLLTYLEREDELHDALNAFAVFTLVDLSGAKYIELIRRVFREKPVDPWYDGDLEEIEMRLGLRSKRSTPPPTNPFGVPLGGWDDEVKPIVVAEKAGRNDPCPCGSGKKYKKCCLNS